MSPMHAPASFSLLPPELAILVFQAACNDDDGTTARSLASVWRYFYEVARPLIYRVVAVHDSGRINSLVEHFQREPWHATYVQHIFIAERSSRLDGSGFENVLRTLWGFVSTTLQSLVLHICSRDNDTGKAFQTVFDAPFPYLTDLTLCGDHPIPSTPLAMPALKRFHTAGLPRRNPAGCFAPLSASCPELSHIRISMASEKNITYAISAAFNLPDAPTDIERMCLDPIPVDRETTYTPFPTLPPGLISLIVKPAAPPMRLFARAMSMFYNQYTKQLEALVPVCPRGRFYLLPAFKREMWEVESYDVVCAKRDWVDCMRGGNGAWNAHGAKSS
ncbi:hypothetical protein FS749_004429 [Ceratobasidium sp. UAMH 11750]|nr:hypothetical protein FS749_004429 [Ceratobasidium sp. UAMH 11750]